MIRDWGIGGGAVPRRTVGEWIVEHGEIVVALAWRDVKTRFSQNFFGYSWTFVAPLLWIAGTFAVFYFLGRSSPVYTDTVTFIVSGLIPFAGFRYTVNVMGRVNNTVRGLLIFPSVTYEHAAVAGALVEFVNILILALVIMAINYFAIGNWELSNFPMWLTGVALAWGLGAGYGYFFSVFSRADPTIYHFGILLLRPSYFLSGVFFTPNELRGDVLAVLSWNPLLHAVEIARDGMLFHYESRVDDPLYVIACIAALFGAAFVARAWQRS